MSSRYEELDFRPTPIGDLMLRRRQMFQFGDLDIYEVKLGEDFLMTSLFHESEDQLAILGLEETRGEELDVVVGGLGLGYTAVAALKDKRINSLVVVEYLNGVIDWHEKNLLPVSSVLLEDSRCEFYNADFFALAKDTQGSFDPQKAPKKYDAILLDIDHSPSNLLSVSNAHFYTHEGLNELKEHLKPQGVFALWSDGNADPKFAAHLRGVFKEVKAHTIEFDNPIHGGTNTGAVYVSR